MTVMKVQLAHASAVQWAKSIPYPDAPVVAVASGCKNAAAAAQVDHIRPALESTQHA